MNIHEFYAEKVNIHFLEFYTFLIFRLCTCEIFYAIVKNCG